jgi:diguanylate cyclase (GGDEF)-like protein
MGMSAKSPTERHPWHQDVQDALDEVRKLIEDVVRREQLRNDLTGLPNERALDQKLEQAIESDEDLWCAFIEIDHFKRINDTYGYPAGNTMIIEVANTLRFSSDRFFGGNTIAFHAHGDEFYLVGQETDDPDSIEQGLETVRGNVAAIRVKVAGLDKPMTATVTIGWVLKSSLQDEEVSRQRVRASVEDAVAYGKRKGRNCTLKYDGVMKKGKFYSERGNCKDCEAAFTMDVERSRLRPESILYCPNCGVQQPRPERPERDADAAAEVKA